MNVSEACRELATHGLVPWSSGNASQRDACFVMAIKGSGAKCERIAFEDISFVKLADGTCNGAKPSTDSEAHRYIYNHCPDVNGIVHTHSTFVTVFAASHKPIPCILTMMADEFGGDIPITEYCTIGGEDIGKEIVRLDKHRKGRLHAAIIRGHGGFFIGPSLEAAVKSAVLAEHCAKTAYFAMRMGTVYDIPSAEIETNYKRYRTEYGQ